MYLTDHLAGLLFFPLHLTSLESLFLQKVERVGAHKVMPMDVCTSLHLEAQGVFIFEIA